MIFTSFIDVFLIILMLTLSYFFGRLKLNDELQSLARTDLRLPGICSYHGYLHIWLCVAFLSTIKSYVLLLTFYG